LEANGINTASKVIHQQRNVTGLSTGNVKWIRQVDLGLQQDVEVIAKLLKPNIGHAMGLL